MTPKLAAMHKNDAESMERAQRALEASGFSVRCAYDREGLNAETDSDVDTVLIPANLLEEVNYSPSDAHPWSEREREYQREIENLKDEVIFYANSTSWKITRPLRKLVQRLKR
ncbi:MAG TPA: hypothetical protein PKD55_04835 [Bellilinea sp.]|nr:hypothetical protein [Bellilinea sp.]